jgi:hypothetical protein
MRVNEQMSKYEASSEVVGNRKPEITKEHQKQEAEQGAETRSGNKTRNKKIETKKQNPGMQATSRIKALG